MSASSMAAEEPRAKRTTKKPAWLLDNVDPASAEVEGDVKVQRQQHRRSSHNDSSTLRTGTATKQEAAAERQHRPDMPRRMCLNPSCKSPFDSPQWRRGPLGPGTLCNACGTRYARIEAKKRGEKRGGSKLRPQDIAEWQAFEQQLQPPLDVRQAWQQAHAHHSSRFPGQQHQPYYDLQQQQQQYDDDEYEDEAAQGYASYAGDDCPQHVSGQQQAACFDDDELLCQEGMLDDDSPGREAAAADGGGVGPAGAAGSLPWAGLHGLPLHTTSKQQQQLDSGQRLLDPALQLGGSCRDSPYQDEPGLLAGSSRPGNRQRQRRYDEDASDSQEAAACSYHEPQQGCISSSRRPESRGGGEGRLQADRCDQFLHLLAVGEAMIKTEGVAPQDRREAWTEYVEKQLPAEQHKPAHVADNAVGVKRSRFGAEAEEQQVGRPEPLPASVPPQSKDRFERLLAEAEQCIRARSASPLLRPITPQSDIISSSRVVRSEAAAAADAGTTVPRGTSAHTTGAGAGASMDVGGCEAADKSPVPRSRLGDAGRQSRQASLQPLMLPAAATSASNINEVAAGARPTAGGPLGISSGGPAGPTNGAAAAAAEHASTGERSTRRGSQDGSQQTQEVCDSKLLLTEEQLSPGTIAMPKTSPAMTGHLQQQQQQWCQQDQVQGQVAEQQQHYTSSCNTSCGPYTAWGTRASSYSLVQLLEDAALQHLLVDPAASALLVACLQDPAAVANSKVNRGAQSSCSCSSRSPAAAAGGATAGGAVE